ncbi:MAG: fatty acid desaturase, partial [Gemmatimonadetes bacterium]|nr:fatty acid desaturase [Gemmatimonadota bacterium]
LNARIPNYRLEDVMNDHPEFQRVTRITMIDAWRLLRLALRDEARRELVSFASLQAT